MTVHDSDMPVLSLEEWRRIFGLHPWHFWGLADSGSLRATAQAGDDVFPRYGWQSTQCVGRDEIVDAVRSAERLLRTHLGYRPGPQYDEVTMPWPRLALPQWTRTGPWDQSGRWLSIDLPEGEIQAIGVEQRTLLSTSSLTYSDSDGDGVHDLATTTVSTSVTDPAQLAIYVPAAERLMNEPLSETYRIRPVAIQIASGVATIRMPAYLCVRPIRYEGVTAQPLDPASAGVYLSSVDVVQRTTDQSSTHVATAGAVIVWETRPVHGWWCCCGCQTSSSSFAGSPYDPAAVAQAVGRVAVRNARLGQVAVAQAAYDSTSATWTALDWSVCQEPDRVTVRYLAGLATPDGQRMDRDMALVVARLAAAELARPIDAQQPSMKELARWQRDIARQGADESYQVSATDLDNPLGTRAGHIQAWKYIQAMARHRAVVV